MNIEIIAGSPRKGSLSLRVAKHLHNRLQQDWKEDKVGLISLNEVTFPFIQKVWSNAEAAPEELRPVAERMFAADAFILVSPEYNGAYSPALKNFFDHFPKQKNKPFGICTSSDGGMGGIRASQQLLQLVPALFGFALPSLLIVPQVNLKFEEDGTLIDPSFQKMIDHFVAEFRWMTNKLV